MYSNILHKAPVLKPNVSNAGRELLEGLLQKDRCRRLGARDDFVSPLLCWFCCTFRTCRSGPLTVVLFPRSWS